MSYYKYTIPHSRDHYHHKHTTNTPTHNRELQKNSNGNWRHASEIQLGDRATSVRGAGRERVQYCIRAAAAPRLCVSVRALIDNLILVLNHFNCLAL